MFIMQGEEVKLVRHIVSYVENENEMKALIDALAARVAALEAKP